MSKMLTFFGAAATGAGAGAATALTGAITTLGAADAFAAGAAARAGFGESSSSSLRCVLSATSEHSFELDQ